MRRGLLSRRTMVWCGVVLVAVGLATIAAWVVAPRIHIEPGARLYSGRRAFTAEEFAAFKAYVGSTPGVRLQSIQVTGKAPPFVVSYKLSVPAAAECPYGTRGMVFSISPGAAVMGAGLGVFVLVVVVGAWVVNIPQIRGTRWGRH